jgi:hypothetical protein
LGARSDVWQAFKPGEKVPEVDFRKHVAGYAERRSGEPMSTAPSVDKSIYLTLENGKPTALNVLGESDFNRSLGWEAEVGFGGSRNVLLLL